MALNDNKYRPVEFTFFKIVKGERVAELKTGHFHRWGTVTYESRENIVQETVGIVEDKTGKVFTANPTDIKFTDR